MKVIGSAAVSRETLLLAECAAVSREALLPIECAAVLRINAIGCVSALRKDWVLFPAFCPILHKKRKEE